jgi:hypothetical protein
MTLSKPVSILVGIATFWYALYLLLTVVSIVAFFGYVFLGLMTGSESVSNLRNLLTQVLSLDFMLPIHICSLSLEVGLLIFYLIHTFKNTKANEAMRIALGLGHVFLPFVVMPIYYYLYIWREDPPAWAAVRVRKVDQLGESIA